MQIGLISHLSSDIANVIMHLDDLSVLSGSLVTTAWRDLRLWIEETASKYGG
jgi:hypothetical protein